MKSAKADRQSRLHAGFATKKTAGWDRQMYKRRNGFERLFRWLESFRRVFPHFDKLFLGFISLAPVFDALRSVNMP